MPESPEVQELAAFLTARTLDRRLSSVDVVLPKILKTSHAPGELVGRRITGVRRHGKMIEIQTADARGLARLSVIAHFGHDGWVLWHETAPEGVRRAGDAALLARFRLDDGSGFDFTDGGQWKMLTLHIVGNPEDVPAVAKLGLDPLTTQFHPDEYASVLAARRKQIKALLQDQTTFAGIGNAYSDEILHAAKISPIVHASGLPRGDAVRLGEQTWRVLADAAAARHGIAPDQLRPMKHAALRVHRRTGESCPVCGDRIREFRFSGAAAQYCPTCQTDGAVLT